MLKPHCRNASLCSNSFGLASFRYQIKKQLRQPEAYIRLWVFRLCQATRLCCNRHLALLNSAQPRGNRSMLAESAKSLMQSYKVN
jgi:hypothetical protein